MPVEKMHPSSGYGLTAGGPSDDGFGLFTMGSMMPRALGASPRRRSRLTLVVACLFLAFIFVVFPYMRMLPMSHRPQRDIVIINTPHAEFQMSEPKTECVGPPESASVGVKRYLNGPPTQIYKDNLRNDTNYITSWLSAGWTNDVMTIANLIYLAIISDRVPILPMFTPEYHVGLDILPISFGEIFNLTRMRKDIGVPIIEWWDVKDPKSKKIEDIGCWSLWETASNEKAGPRNSRVLAQIGLDISYTRVPDWVASGHNSHAEFWSIAPLTFPETREKSLGIPHPSHKHGTTLNPDEHLFCIDYLYYVCAHKDFEFEYEFSPAWRQVLRHFRWTDKIEEVTGHYLKRALGVSSSSSLPPYIAIHARHGDFSAYCPPNQRCFPSVADFAELVAEVQTELKEKKGLDVEDRYVIVTSDEKDERWWEEVAKRGWKRMDYGREHVAQIYGAWYPTIMDAVLQSNAIGFVGTDRSTYSLIAARRVQDWHGGVTRMMKWGPW